MTIREHVIEQLTRLDIFRDFRLMEAGPRKEYRNWIERRSEGNRERVTQFIDSVVMLDELPLPSAMESLWRTMFPPVPTGKECDPACPDCNGSSWRTIERDGESGAEKCPCGSRPASEAAMKAHWEREKRRIAKHESEALAKWRDEMKRDLTRQKREVVEVATPSEIAAIKAEQERNRAPEATSGIR